VGAGRGTGRRCQTGRVSYVFGGRPGKQDPELAKAAQRRRAAFAKDIGDEYGRAFAHEPPPRKRRWTGIVGLVLVLFAGFGLIPLLRGSDGGLVRVSCDQPAVGVSAGTVLPGDKAAWQVAGPDSGEYVITIDGGGKITAPPSGGVRTDVGLVLAGPFRITGCRSTQTVFTAPTNRGTHEITLYRRASSAAAFAPVAGDALKVG
jgi:hypothetical protein